MTAAGRRLRTGLIFALLGCTYLVVPYRVASRCLGMECISFLITGAPVALLSVPWSLPARWLQPDPEVEQGPIYRGALLHPTYAPRYAFIAGGFLANLFLVGLGLQRAIDWLRGRRHARRTVP